MWSVLASSGVNEEAVTLGPFSASGVAGYGRSASVGNEGQMTTGIQ